VSFLLIAMKGRIDDPAFFCFLELNSSPLPLAGEADALDRARRVGL
jgi:hypothetical protein